MTGDIPAAAFRLLCALPVRTIERKQAPRKGKSNSKGKA